MGRAGEAGLALGSGSLWGEHIALNTFALSGDTAEPGGQLTPRGCGNLS